ncbi:hypothetical protein D1007_46332 [Hordeum vulgare]|nr:hypothetical protein D1007_46332 [Hordeum vulgare]
MDEDVISPVKVFPSLPEDGGPMSVHMEYCSEQLKKFDMVESDEEDDGELPEMQCLPQELIKTIGSTKRSLLSSLDDADSEKRGKFQTRPHVKWGPILSNRPTTRDHGDVKIMDKAKAYQKKKNLEIPISFKGNSFPCLGRDNLMIQAKKIDICIGENELEQAFIIDDIIEDEKIRGLQFSELNPEIVLPSNLDEICCSLSSHERGIAGTETGALLFQ